jgi:broad specificity phosphatase PhoE
MQRCLETRELVAARIPFEIEPVLREVDFGKWEGQTLEWAERNAPELLAQRRRDPVRFRPPGGESIEDAAARLRPLAARLRNRERTLVIAHRLSLGILERLLRGLPLDSKRVKQLEPGEFRIVMAS